MKKIKKQQLVFIISICTGLIFSSCGSDTSRESQVSTIISHISDPMLVVNFSPGSLIEKSGAMEDALPFTQKMLLGFFIDDSVTGIDYDIKSQIVVTKGEQNMPNVYGISKIRNETSFINLMQTELNAEVQERDGFKFVVKDEDLYVIVWNDEFAMASNIPLSMNALMGGSMTKEGEKRVDELMGHINAVDDEESDAYLSFLENKADIGFNINGKGLYAYLEMMTMDEEELQKNKEMIEASSGDLFISFNDGNIAIDAVSRLSDELKAKMNVWKDGSISTDLLAFGASSNPILTLGYALNVENFLAQIMEEDGMYNTMTFEEELGEFGLTMEELAKGIDGDILFVVDRIEIKKQVIDWGYGEPYETYNPEPIFAIVTSISDESVLGRVLAEFDTLGGGVYTHGDAYLAKSNDVFFATNDSAWAYNFVGGNLKTIKDEANIFNDFPLAAYFDFKKVAEMENMGSEKKLIEMMRYAKMTGNLDEMNMTFQFKDESKNALRILTETISRMTDEGPDTEEARQIEQELVETAEPY